MADIVVEPKSSAPMAADTVPEPPAKAASGGISDELLQIPAMQALFAGQPAALSTPIKEFSNRPEAKIIEENKDAIQRAGVGFYRSLAGDLGVLFNQLHIAGQDLIEADKQGRLTEVAPLFDEVNQAVSMSGEGNPVLSAQVPGGAKTANISAPAPAPAPAPASVQNKLTTARLKNTSLGAPTSGPQPGAGRILNTLLKPAV